MVTREAVEKVYGLLKTDLSSFNNPYTFMVASAVTSGTVGGLYWELIAQTLKALLALDNAAREHIRELIEDYDFGPDSPIVNRLRAALLPREGE